MRFLLGFFLIVLVSCTATRSKRPTTLVILGSSTSACTGPKDRDSCYVQRLRSYYAGAGRNVTIQNLAVGGYDPYHAMPTGWTPPPGRRRPDTAHNLTRALALKPDVLLVNFPSNGYCDYTVTEVMDCFRLMDAQASAAGVRTYFTTTQPRETNCYLTSAGKQKLIAINDSLRAQFGGRVIDFFTPVADPADSSINNYYDSGDHIHLNNAGHRQLFEAARKGLRF